jgi:hypothetical protein
MDSLRKEIQDEMTRSRLDKTRLYELMDKIVSAMASGTGREGPSGPRGPAGAAGPAGPAGPAGSDGVCTCKCTSVEEAPAKKIVKKKTSSTST